MPKSYKPAPENPGLTRLDFPGPAGYVRVTEFPYVTEDANEQAFLDAHPMLVGEEVKEPKATQKARPAKPEESQEANEDRED